MARITPETDAERLAERLWRQARGSIEDRESFDEAYEQYLSDEGANPLSNAQDKKLREKVWQALNKFHNITKKNVFKEAGGKDLKRDRQRTAKVVVSSVQEYKRRGASNVDLKGYDTKRPRRSSKRNVRRKLLTAQRQAKYKYNYSGRVKSRIVPARRIITKKGARFIDRKGRYVSVKR